MLLEKAFRKIGARVVARPYRYRTLRTLLSTGKVLKHVHPESPRDTGRPVQIDVRRDRGGEYFDIRYRDEIGAPEVLDVDPGQRHLVVMVRAEGKKQKYICGHDERHWFVAAVPGDSVKDVNSAKAALRPDIEGPAIRQGEWFFVPAPDADIQDNWRNPIHRNEPLSRGNGSKPHICDEIYRFGGIVTFVDRNHPMGVSREQMNAIIAEHPEKRVGWREMTRDAEVYARGAVRHADHATIVLDGWHRVYLNQERFASWSTNVVFLD